MTDEPYRRMFEASGTPIARADANTLQYRSANQAYCDMVGYSVDELRGMTPLDLTVPEDAVREGELFAEVMNAELPAYSLEKRFIHKSGRIVWASVSVTVYRDEEGKPHTGVAICQDVTARREAAEARLRFETELLQSQKLEGLGLLAGGIAHDFNNLLVGIVGNAELARRGADAKQAALLDDVLASARAGAELCQQMLAYSGGANLERLPIGLGEVVSTAVRLLDSEKRSAIELAELGDDCIVDGDLIQLRQLVLSLATNAYEALSNPREGVIVRVVKRPLTQAERAKIVIGEAVEDACVCLEVEDRGVGFATETLESAFEPFHSTKGPGRGLGLAAVMGIVRSHDAALVVDTEQGKGTRMLVAFRPSAESPRPVVAPEVQAEGLEESLSILLVDDDRTVRTTIARMLEAKKHAVQTAEGVATALSSLGADADRFDVVITDLTLGDGSGNDVLSRAREHDLPVLLITGYSTEHAEDGRGAPIAALQKPFTLAELLGALARLLKS